MSTDAARILGWLLAASDGVCIVNDLIEHEHVLAAACQPGIVDIDDLRKIVAGIEHGTGDDLMVVAGIALSGIALPWLLVDVVGQDSPLRPGMLYIGWSPGWGPTSYYDTITNCRAAADPQAKAVQAQIHIGYGTSGDVDTAIDLCLKTQLGFVIGYESLINRNKWAACACELAACDELDPEVALLISLRGATHMHLDGVAVDARNMATVLADAFGRRHARLRQLALPPIIV